MEETPPSRADETSSGPRVLIVEDHELLAQSLTFTLRGDGIHAERSPMTTADDVVAFAEEHTFDVVLLDLDLGAELGSGLDLVKPLQQTGARVVMLTGVTDAELLAECVEAGAIGLVSKQESFEHLMSSLREAIDLGTLLSPGQRDDLIAELREPRQERTRRLAAFSSLTRRERQVLGELMDGRTAEEIANAWFVSITTVRSQVRSLLLKLDVHSQIAAVGLARRAGWQPEPGD